MNSLMRYMFPLLNSMLLCFADDGAGGEGGDGDGGSSDADKTSSDDAAGDKSKDVISIPKKDYDRLTGRLGQLEDAERRRADEKKKADDEEAKKRGEHEKLLTEREKEIESLKPWPERYAKRVKADHERRMKAIDTADEKVKKQFRVPDAGKELSVDEMEANLNKLDEYESLGLVAVGAAAVKPGAPAAGGGTPAARVPAQTPQQGAPAFNPWNT